MENLEDRRAEMVAQAEQTMAESRYREAMARTATTCVAGALALGLREQGLSDKAIGEVLTMSRNRVPDLVREGIWPSPMLGDQRLRRYAAAALEDSTDQSPIQPPAGSIASPVSAAESRPPMGSAFQNPIAATEEGGSIPLPPNSTTSTPVSESWCTPWNATTARSCSTPKCV